MVLGVVGAQEQQCRIDVSAVRLGDPLHCRCKSRGSRRERRQRTLRRDHCDTGMDSYVRLVQQTTAVSFLCYLIVIVNIPRCRLTLLKFTTS